MTDPALNDLEAAIDIVLRAAATPQAGLPDQVFTLVSRLTPLVNVDLLIKDPHLGCLLTWRDDAHYGPGWHVPGGIIRYKEAWEHRIRLVARQELAVRVQFNPMPIAIHQLINPSRDVRGHFISLLFECQLETLPRSDWQAKDGAAPLNGQWRWHTHAPDNLISQHHIYRPHLNPNLS
jgi:ADP-ribose pyrophosphatase YjhB (NUDIX family)